MGKSVQQFDDEGLPIPTGNHANAPALDGDGLPIPKKKDENGSASPSDSSPNTGKTGQPVNTSGSDQKALTNNYKNHSLTPSDVNNPQSAIGLNLPSADQISHSINNKSDNLSKWQNASSDSYIGSLVNQHQQVQKRITDMETYRNQRLWAQPGNSGDDSQEIDNLKKQESYLRSEIQKNYDSRKGKLVPELIDHVKTKLGVDNLSDEYDKPEQEIAGIKIKSPLQWNPETHKLTPESVQKIAGIVDDAMNNKGDAAANAQVSGDLDKKKRTYEDLTRSVVDQLNMIPVQKAQEKFTKEYADKNTGFKDALDANQKVNEFFSKEKVNAVKAKVNVDRDKALIQTGHKYYGEGGVFQSNSDFVGIQHKYAQLVGEGKMSDAVAKSQIQAEIKQNPALKKINENMEAEVRKINEKTQTEFQNYIVAGLRKDHPKLTVYKDGSVGLASLSEDQYKNMMEGYEEGLQGVAKKMGMESEAATTKIANDKAKKVGAFWGSLGSSLNDLTGAFSKVVFNKTQWGAKNVQYYEAQDIASPQINQSQIAASWNWKGVESLIDPNFWLSKTGAMVPVIAGASAVGLATEGAGMPEYVGWLANAGLFTAQSGLSTYNQMLNTRDAQGNLLTEADASTAMASQMEKDFLPNLLMMAATSGTLLKAKNIARPTIGGAVKKGILGAAEAQPFFTWSGYNDYATAQEAQGKQTDFWDYMQTKDFRDNLINGMVVGGGLSLLHAPGAYMKSVDNYTRMIHSSEGEFKNLIPQNYALGQEMNGSGNYLRDALKLHVFNVDPDGLNEEGKRQLADLKNTLLYSTNLDRNIRQGNLDPKSIKDLYQAHNLALADQHDYLSDEAAKQGNKSLSDIYKDKAKDYREQAKAASNGEAKYHYLTNDQGEPIFMSDKSFKALDQEGTIAKWLADGTIQDIHSSDDPGFAERYKEHVQAKNEANVEGKTLQEHAVDMIEENKKKLGTLYDGAKKDPEAFYKYVADQAFGRDENGGISKLPNAEQAARDQYGNDIVDAAKMMFPLDEKAAAVTPEKTEEKPTEEIGEYKKNIRDDYFAKADFFTPEEKEKFATLDESGQDKMIDEKRSELSGIPVEENISSPESKLKTPIIIFDKESGKPISDEDDDTANSLIDKAISRSKTTDQANSKLDALGYSMRGKINDEFNDFVQDRIDGKTTKTFGEWRKERDFENSSISSPKIEQDGKKTKEAEGRQGDVLAPEKEGAGGESSDAGAAPPFNPVPPIPRTPEESPKDEFVSVRKEKNKEIEGAKELFEKQKVIKWNDTYREALTNVHSMYPDKNLYDAMKERVGHFTAMLEGKHLFNPTSEDNAVFNVYKLETMRRMSQVQGFDSSDPIQQLAAQTEFSSLQKDLLDVARVTNPGGEAGRAFNILQSEIANDLEHGLQIRRMEIAAAKGSKLTDAELESTAADWHKEQELLQKQHDLELQRNEEKFNKVIDGLKKQLEKAPKEGKEPTVKQKREKLLSEKGKDLADRIRGGKLKGTYATFPGLPQAINVVLEGIAQIVEKGATLAEAISQYVKDHKIKDEEQFKTDLFSVFTKQEKKEDAYSKIEDMAKNGGVTDVTNDMVAKNLIRDYVNSHVGLHDNKDILDVAHAQLKKVLPDLDKNKLREAYLKDGDFKQPTKKQLENSFKQSERNFNQLTKLEKDINDLKQKGDLFKKTSDKGTTPYDKEIAAKEKEKKAIMTEMGIKTSSEDKYTKASYDQRATAHNERLENLSKDIEGKFNKGGLSLDTEKSLRNLKGKIDASKIVLDPTSALSQERTLKGGDDLLKSIASEFRRTTIGDISKVGDINRSLQRAIDKFGSDKDESEQDIKLQRAKDKAKTQKDEYARRLAAGEFEDHPIVELTKSDAELIKVERDRNKERQKFEDTRKDFEKKNAPQRKRIFGFVRAAEVASLIWRPMTFLRVGASALLRPNMEALTKATFGKGFASLPFDTTKAITEQAKKGGESSSNRAIAKLYESQFKQFTPEQIKGIYDKANDKYEKSDSEYQKAFGELNQIYDKDSKEYKDQFQKVNDLKGKKQNDLIDAIYTSVYQFIGGSSVKEAVEVLLHRSTELERQLGDFDREAFEKFKEGATGKEKFNTRLDNINYVLNFIGRSHAALKNFSARASFASGFMARLEGYSNDGVDITRPEKLLEIAHESYHDWESGKYQDKNWITDTWNKATNAVEKASPELAFLMKADVAITRVPVNLLREGIMEYTLGAFRGSVMAAREYYKAKGIVLADGYTPENDAQFEKELQEQLQKIDPKQAATIIRAFRKGGLGLGLYALALVGKVAFGGWAHKGMTAEDKKKMEREQDTGIPEIKTSQIKIGDYTLPDWASKVVEHTPVFAPLGFGLGLSQVYQNNIIDGKTTPEAATNAVMGQVDHITNSIPQLDKVVLPLAGGVAKSVVPSGQWDDVDTDGNPMKRKAFEIGDYFKYLHLFDGPSGKPVGIGNKENILSENYYKQAVGIQKSYRQQITEVEINTSLSKSEKEEQRADLLNEMKEAIDDVYKQNREDPQ